MTPCEESRYKTTDRDGYVLIKISNGIKYVTKRLYRLKWVAVNGELPPGFDLHHKCENKKCVNLDHLEVMSHSEHSKLHRKGT